MRIKVENFNLKDTFECGQCFRWNSDENGVYTGVVGNNVVKMKQRGDVIELESEFEGWREYFDLDTDYNKIISAVSVDEVMKSAVMQGSGIRILRQELFESVISFIISQNNNIPRIKNIIEKLCRGFGKHISGEYYSFPSAEALDNAQLCELAYLKAGYRDEYIKSAAEIFAGNKINIDVIVNGDIKAAREEISGIKGVGPKVADCILLFGAHRTEVFPTDVWVKRVLSVYYGIENASPPDINRFAKEKYGEYAGFAQQYLFYKARNDKIGK